MVIVRTYRLTIRTVPGRLSVCVGTLEGMTASHAPGDLLVARLHVDHHHVSSAVCLCG